MLTARQKLKENIIEYLLYMYQIEDIVRSTACNFAILKEKLIPAMVPDTSYQQAYEQWYAKICEELLRTGKTQKGHLYELEEIFTELILLHRTMLDIFKDSKYAHLVQQSAMSVEEYASKAGLEQAHPVEVCLHAMYMKLQLKLRSKEISEETEKAMDGMRAQLAYLAKAYHNMKSGAWGNPNLN